MIKSFFNLILIGLLFASSLGFVAYRLVQPEFLIKEAREVKLYEQLANEIDTLLPEDKPGEIVLSKSDLHEVITNAIDPETFYQLLDSYATTYLQWLTGRSDSLELNVSFTSQKAKIQEKLATKLIADYHNLPVCKQSELKTWQATSGLPSCQLPESNVQSKDVDNLLKAQAAQSISQIPDQLTGPQENSELLKARSRVITTLGAIKVIWIMTAVFILLYLAVFRRKAFLPLAFIFLAVGLLEVAFSFVAWDWIKRLILDYVLSPQAEGASVVVTDLVGAIIEVLKTLLGNLSIIMLSIGGFFLIVWAFYLRSSKPQEATPQRLR